MPYVNSKRALDQENELLAILLKATNSYVKTLKPDSLGAYIAKDWAGSFRKLQKLNTGALADDDRTFEKTFVDEKELLSRFLAVTKGSGFGKSWAQLFKKDIEIADRLLADNEPSAKARK